MRQRVAREGNVVKTGKNPHFYVSDAIDCIALGKDAIRKNEMSRAQTWYKKALQAFKNANSLSGGKWAVEQDKVKAEYTAIVLSRRRVS
jgi:hypothetical protein